MFPNSGNYQRWKILVMVAFCETVLLLRFCAASHSEVKTEEITNLPGQIYEGAHAYGEMNKTLRHELEKGLQALPEGTLERLVGYYKGEETAVKEIKVNKETLIWTLLIYGFGKTVQRSFINQVLSFVLTKQRDYKCYDTVGCFNLDNRMALEIGGPVSPQEAGVKFYFYDRSKRSGIELSPTIRSSILREKKYSTMKPLFIIVHGFKENSQTRQVVNLTSTLLDNVECDVITVDWKKAASFPYYATAAANSPLVGAEISVLLQEMHFSFSLLPEKVHLIGFSLGAHAAGFCGRHFHNKTRKRLGRITGLDPAGLLFENPNASLSSTDAEYVDVIHTNGGQMTDLHFGKVEPMGHIDFYPNGGKFQTGCTGSISDLTCSHNRAWWYFIESVKNTTCSFKSITCEAGWYSYNSCLCNTSRKSAVMGYYSKNVDEKGQYYLRTNPDSPFCIETEPSCEATSVTDHTTTKPPR